MILRDKFTSRSKVAATDPQLRKVEIIDNREHLACLLFLSPNFCTRGCSLS